MKGPVVCVDAAGRLVAAMTPNTRGRLPGCDDGHAAGRIGAALRNGLV